MKNDQNCHWFNLMCLSVAELAAIEMIEVQLHRKGIEYANISKNGKWKAGSIPRTYRMRPLCAKRGTHIRVAFLSLTSSSQSTSASI